MTRLSHIGSKTKTITHHLDVATLMSFAAGSLPEALAAVAAQHITRCPQCARELKRMESIGASMLGSLAPESLSRPAPTLALRRELEDGARSVTGHYATGITSAKVNQALENFAATPWKRLGIGLWHAPVALTPGATGDLRLLKVGPGRRLPEHGHGGSELTLILQGSYTDEIGKFSAGDIADLDDTIEHRPIADADEGCICLVAFEHQARFSGLLPRLFQPLTGM